MCSWAAYVDCSITVKDLLDMHRSLNLKDFLESQLMEGK